MLRLLLPVALLLVARPAAAQIDDNAILRGVSHDTLNIEECEGNTLIVYSATVTIAVGQTTSDSQYALEFGDGCVEGPPADTYTECGPGVTGCCQLEESGDMLVAGADQEIGGDIRTSEFLDCVTDTKSALKFILKVEAIDRDDIGGTAQQWASATTGVTVDLVRPDRPATPEIAAGESTAEISWDSETAPGDHVACVFRGDYNADLPIGDQSLDNKQCSPRSTDGAEKIAGLEVGLTYTAVLSAFDGSGNESLPSEPTIFVTQEITDFYELYRREYGGGDPGGYCASAPGAPGRPGAGVALFLGLLLLLSTARRRWARLGLGGSVALLLAAAPAVASAESPKFMTFEFRVGSWLPAVDSEFGDLDASGAAGPYQTVFGDQAATVIDLEFAAHIYQGYGTGSLGVGLGTGSVSGHGVNPDGTQATEKSDLSLTPLSLFLGYAFDWPAEEFGFPIVPYGKVGVDWVLWSTSDGEGEPSSVADPEGSGEGGTVGWHYAVGGRLLLDALDPSMARTFDLDLGVNNSYLFVEYFDATIDDFGDANAMHLDAEVVFWGLAFDF